MIRRALLCLALLLPACAAREAPPATGAASRPPLGSPEVRGPVLRPPMHVDPGIQGGVPVPKPNTTPVIPPPAGR